MDLNEYCVLLDIDKTAVSFVDMAALLQKKSAIALKAKGYIFVHNVINPRAMKLMRQNWGSEIWTKMRRKREINAPLFLGQKNCTYSLHGRATRHFEFYWNPPTFKLSRDISLLLHYARNVLTNLHPLYGLIFSPKREGIYLAVTHYPIGSGEMLQHKDPNYFLPVQFILPLSFKGEDYRGGGLMLHLDSTVIDADEQMKLGSVLLFKGILTHSVEKIQGSGSKSSFGRLQLFSIPTEFIDIKRHGLLRKLYNDLQIRMKYWKRGK